MKLVGEIAALERLESARERMGAPLTPWTSRSPLPKWKPITRVIGKSLGEVVPLDGHGPLVHEGQQVLLYIKDTRLNRRTLLDDPENSRRFHISECRTIERMRLNSRFERYVVTNNISGVFKVESTDPHTGEVEDLKAELYVCKNCLDTLGLASDRSNWPEFSISGFFRDYETFFSSYPGHSDVTTPRGGYPRNWKQISSGYREQMDWTCEECGVCLTEMTRRSLLHTHHRNGVVSDNRPENLQALCAECHDKQPGHGGYPLGEKEKALLARLRHEPSIQGQDVRRRA